MESNERPFDCDRMLLNVREHFPCREESSLFGDELIAAFERKLLSNDVQASLPQGDSFTDELRQFISDLVAKQNDSITTLCDKDLIIHSMGLSSTQLEKFILLSATRFVKSFCEPGEAVGALCATSVGEPTTQMTLKVSRQHLRVSVD